MSSLRYTYLNSRNKYENKWIYKYTYTYIMHTYFLFLINIA